MTYPLLHANGTWAILIIGWIVALIISNVVRGVLRRATLDDKISLWLAGGDSSKSIDSAQAVSKTIYYIIMLFVLLAFFQALHKLTSIGSINTLLNQLLQ